MADDPSYIVDNVLTDGEAWVAVASSSLGSDAATVTFTSTDDGQVGDFSQYMDLMILGYCRSARIGTTAVMFVYLNSDTTDSNYASQYLRGSGAAVSVAANASPYMAIITGSTAGANEFAAVTFQFSDMNSGKYKTFLTQSAADSAGDGWMMLSTATWKSQSAIAAIALTPSGGDLVAGSRFDLFGILPRMVTA